MIVRKITRSDAEKFRELRLYSLKESPASFGGHYDEDREKDLQTYLDRIPEPDSENASFVAENEDGDFIGLIGFIRVQRIKMRHRGNIFGVYVRPEARGQGVGRALMEAVMAHVRLLKDLRSISLTVVSSNVSAIRLYEAFGFRIWGTEPEVLRVDGQYYDEHHMILTL